MGHGEIGYNTFRRFRSTKHCLVRRMQNKHREQDERKLLQKTIAANQPWENPIEILPSTSGQYLCFVLNPRSPAPSNAAPGGVVVGGVNNQVFSSPRRVSWITVNVN